MKNLIAILLTCLPLCAATMYPVLTDNSTRTFSGGGTNLALLNTARTFTAAQTFTGQTNLGTIYASGQAIQFTDTSLRQISAAYVGSYGSIYANGFYSDANYQFSTDLFLRRNAANTLELDSGTTGIANRGTVLAAVFKGRAGTSSATFNSGGVIFAQTTTNATTNVDGTEDDLYSVTLAANTFSADLQSVVQVEHVNLVSSATAARRVKRYFGGTLIFDSGALTLEAGGDFTINTHLIRHSSSVVMALVEVASTSASTVPYVTATTVSGLTLSNSQILKTTGIASGAGAAASDITNDRIIGKWYPAP